MNQSGKSPKEIYDLITEKYGDLGEGTPTPEPK
jgi:cytochrome c-type biogenesis protein CcmH/NrfF